MPDDTTIALQTGGDSIATRDTGTGHKIQRVIPSFGASGEPTDVSAASPLPVALGGATVPVTDNGGSLTVDGTVGVSGTVTVDGSGHTQPVSGTVNVGNLPATQPVSGTVNVGNLPAAQPVTDNGGTLSVDDGGGSLTVDGTLSVAPQYLELSNTNVTASGVVIASTDVRGYSGFTLQMQGGAGTYVVEASNDNTNWKPVPAVSSDGVTSAVNFNGHTVAAAPWTIGSVAGRYMRVRCSAFTSGPTSVILELNSVSQPSPFPLPVAGANVEYTGTITQAAGVSGTAGTGIDARGYSRWILQLSGVYTGTPIIQFSNDNANWFVADRYFLPGNGLGGYTNQISSGANTIVSGPVNGRYVKISYNAFTSGTATYTLELSDTQSPYVYAQTPLPAATALGDATANPNTTVVGSFPHIFGANSSWDRWKSISSVGPSMTTNTPGVAAVGVVGFDGTNTYRPLKVDSSQLLWVSVQGAVDTELPSAGAVLDGFANPTTPMVGVVGMVFNGSTWDRQRSATTAAGTTGMGVSASAPMGFDGTNYQRAKAATDGTLVTMGRATASALTSVAASVATGVSLLAADVTRRGAVIYNESTATLYLALGAGATTTAYSYQVSAGGTWEMPATCCYTGAITGTWSAANGNARITSLTA